MDSLLFVLLAGYGACAMLFTVVWAAVGYYAWQKERAWTRERR